MIPIKPYGYFLLASLLISACSNQTTIPPELAHQTSDQAIPEEWTITAKLGIRTADDSGSVTLHWQQQQSQYHIRVSGPLGQGGGVLSGDSTHITVTRPNKGTLYSNNPEQLIRDTFGWELPLQHLNYWIRGVSSPYIAVTQEEYSAENVLSNLQQADWSIRYQRYSKQDLWLMPQKIRAEKDGIVLNLIIKQWRFPQSLTKHQ